MHGDMFLVWFATTYPSAVEIIKEKTQQLGSGETPSRSSNWIEEEEDDFNDVAPVARSNMSEFMRANIRQLRVDHGMEFLSKIVIAATNNVRCKDLVRVDGEGKTLWSVVEVQDTTETDPETAEEFNSRHDVLETQTRKDRIRRRIDQIQVITLLVHPEVYCVVQLANLLMIVSGAARVTQIKEEEPETLSPIEEEFTAPKEGD
jgi:hypothetical protein